ncbi:MAG: head GIN domain-containing protein [Bacteroidota bacterium]
MRLIRILFYSALIFGLAIYFYGDKDIETETEFSVEIEQDELYEFQSLDNVPFQSLSLSCNCTVKLKQADNWSVAFEDKGKFSSLDGHVQDGTYYLTGGHSNWGSDEEVSVTISAPYLSRIETSGTSTLESDGSFKTETLDLHLSGATEVELDLNVSQLQVSLGGAAELELSGSANQADYSINGAGELDAFDLKSSDVKLAISGAGDAEVYVSNALDANVLGAGDVRYKGHPQHVRQHISGVGSIRAD